MAGGKQVVLITGCSTGIGFALATEYDRKGAQVYATARNVSSLDKLPSTIKKVGLDVVNAEQREKVVQDIIASEGRIDILVNNAGQGATGPVLDFGQAELESVFNTNVFAPLALTQLVVPHMVKARSGLIVNIGSVAGTVTTPWAGIYSSTKAALHAWTDALRMEVKAFGINVLLVAPGGIISSFGTKQLESIKLREGSLYTSVAGRIAHRANMSQDPKHSWPASKLAQGIVARSLTPKPAVYYSAGGKSVMFWIMQRLPSRFVWWLLARMLGANDVKVPK